MSLLDRITKRSGVGRKSWTQPDFWSLEAARSSFYTVGGFGSDREQVENDFPGYVEGAYKRNGAIFACMLARQMAFSEVRFQWCRFSGGRRTELFGNNELLLLERPWVNGTTGELLARMIQDADLAGNAYNTRADDEGRLGNSARGAGLRITRLRPDWVSIILGSKSGNFFAGDTKILLYRYEPPGGPAVDLLPEEVSHFSPIPDPLARFRGMSWLTPVLREIEADSRATVHKKKFLENAAVPNMAVKFDKDISEDEFDEFVEKFRDTHQGAMNAHKTLFLMGGADVTPLTYNFRDLEFNQSISKGETRIAAAAGVPPQWVGFSDGMSGSGLNSQGVYAAARRRFADGTMRPLWRVASGCLETLFEPPAGASLWFDVRDVAFLREDTKDQADIFHTSMIAINQGILAGYQPDAVISAALEYDLTVLRGQHTGLTSVQMQEPHSAEVGAERDQADLVKVQADAIATLAGTGRFTEESIVDAVQTGDLTKLKPNPQPAPATPPPPPGSPPTDPAAPPEPQPGGGNAA